jgi:hypothetical protein
MANKGGWVLEHRQIMSDHIGKAIPKDAHVHHINGIKDDNRLENLQLISASEHAGISNKQGASQRTAMKKELENLRAEVEAYRLRYGPLGE